MRTNKSSHTADEALALFREHGGTLRTGEALALGIHPRTLYRLRDDGLLEQLARGLYRLADLPPLDHPDLVTVARQVPRGVICLISALAFYELTTQVPHAVDVALQRGDERPRLTHPPLRVFWYAKEAWEAGIRTHDVGNTLVRIYSPAKSVADALKFRRRIGVDVAIEALRNHVRSPAFRSDELLHYARICRVQGVLHSYLEALA